MKTEKQFLVKLLLTDEKFRSKNFEELDCDNIIKIGSKNLILPAIYLELKSKNLFRHFDSKFLNYLNFIYENNLLRNRVLINEIDLISKKLLSFKINHVFIKGAAHISANIYNDLGERMIGDIDLLVAKEHISKAQNALMDTKYFSMNKKDFFSREFRHISRMKSKKKMFAVEIHKKIVNKENLISITTNDILKNKVFKKNLFIPARKDQILINIYNQQLNDKGFIKSSYNFRSLRDNHLLNKTKKNLNLDFENHDKYIVNYKYIIEKLNISNTSYSNENSLTQRLKFTISNNSLNARRLLNIYVTLINFFEIKSLQLKKFLSDNNYREYVKEKIKKLFMK